MSCIVYIGLWANPPFTRLTPRFAHLADDVAAGGFTFRLRHFRDLPDQASPSQFDQWLGPAVAGVILSGSRLDLTLGACTQPETVPVAVYAPLVDHLRAAQIPILGICFGHQLLALSDGGTLGRLPAKRRASDHPVTFLNDRLLTGIAGQAPRPAGSTTITVPENHQIVVQTVDPERWQVLAQSMDGIEAIAHCDHPWIGVQFHPEYHPESRSADGRGVLLNWLRMVGAETRQTASTAPGAGEHRV